MTDHIEDFKTTGDIHQDATLLRQNGALRSEARNILFGLYYSKETRSTEEAGRRVNSVLASVYGPECVDHLRGFQFLGIPELDALQLFIKGIVLEATIECLLERYRFEATVLVGNEEYRERMLRAAAERVYSLDSDVKIAGISLEVLRHISNVPNESEEA